MNRIQRTSEEHLMCPLCGQSGRPEEEAAGSAAAFVSRGEVDGHSARKCFVCGSGFVVVGANTEPIPASRWAQIEALYEEQQRERGESSPPSPDSRR